MSATRGAIKMFVGAGAFYFVVMRNLGAMSDWYNSRYIERVQERQLLRTLAQEKQAMLEEGS